jgi:hypothetical protein
MGADTDDDGIYHYINIITKDVYSFDIEDEIWLEKNLYQPIHLVCLPKIYTELIMSNL